MDEKRISEEFANIWKTLESNTGDLLENTKMLHKIIDMSNHNAKYGNEIVAQFNRVKAKQSLFIAIGIAGYFFLSARIKKLEDSTKKE